MTAALRRSRKPRRRSPPRRSRFRTRRHGTDRRCGSWENQHQTEPSRARASETLAPAATSAATASGARFSKKEAGCRVSNALVSEFFKATRRGEWSPCRAPPRRRRRARECADAETATKTRESGFSASASLGDHSHGPRFVVAGSVRSARRRGFGATTKERLEHRGRLRRRYRRSVTGRRPERRRAALAFAGRHVLGKAELRVRRMPPRASARAGAPRALARAQLSEHADPNANTSPARVTTALCRFAAATSIANASRSAPATRRGVRWYSVRLDSSPLANRRRGLGSPSASRASYPSRPSAPRPQENTAPRRVTASVWCFPRRRGRRSVCEHARRREKARASASTRRRRRRALSRRPRRAARLGRAPSYAPTRRAAPPPSGTWRRRTKQRRRRRRRGNRRGEASPRRRALPWPSW